MKESEFIKVIEDLVLAFEASGVNDANLKTTIDRLFDLKQVLEIKEALGKEEGTCYTCSHQKEGACTLLSATVSEQVKIEFFPPGKNNRLKIQVPLMFRCKFHKY